jgi:hypothetical protein
MVRGLATWISFVFCSGGSAWQPGAHWREQDLHECRICAVLGAARIREKLQVWVAEAASAMKLASDGAEVLPVQLSPILQTMHPAH